MARFGKEQIRNLALIGHGGAGKTSLAEAILFCTGAVDRLGRVDEGTTVMDYEPEEQQRLISIQAAVHRAEWKKCRVNLVDTPGYANFIGDTRRCLQAVEGAVLVVEAVSEIKVEGERVWQYADEFALPRVAFVNKMDRERADFAKALEELDTVLKANPVAVQLPIGKEDAFRGVIDLRRMKALVYATDGSGKVAEEEIPGPLRAEADAARERLIEKVAEADDALTEKYLEQGTLAPEEVVEGLRQGVLQRKFTPVLCGSGLRNMGLHPLLDLVIEVLPSPVARSVAGVHPQAREPQTRQPEEQAPFAALVFKTIADSFAGKLSVFRIFSGTLQADSQVYNATRGARERFGQVFELEGKKQKAVGQASVGDIVAVAKLKETQTGDTLCDEARPVLFETPAEVPAVLSFALSAKVKGEEEKVFSSLGRLIEEDPSLKVHRDEQTKEIILSGLGQLHVEVAVEKLKRKFGVEVELKAPKVPYKETIRGRTKIQGKYKKQSGGRGQYGDTWIEIEPLPRGGGFEFVDKIVGGAIPRQYIPAVEKGIREAMAEGIVAGYPVVDLRVTLYDGSYHTVDSSEMAFKIAASLGFKKGFLECTPVLLEPVMLIEIVVPEEHVGDVIGDLNSRRGRVLGVDVKGRTQGIKGQVPMAEVLQYAS
ncbi:MAG: elongation factor G, partial [Deltaproteobacteria bacterium]|nr:elongation factor G [Deltaproteobacteria bacterium]